MNMWKTWYIQACRLRASCSNYTTFLWLLTILISFSIRIDLAGVTSFIRTIAIDPRCYYCMLHFFHSKAINIDDLTHLWINICLSIFSIFLIRHNDRIILVADGIKAPKEGKKMPGVKLLHQESNNNCKAEYIMGHYVESIAVVAGNMNKTFAVPLLGRLHGGVLFSKEDENKTLIDRFIELLKFFFKAIPFMIVVDAYYAAKKLMIYAALTENHLLTRMRSNAVAWEKYSGLIKDGQRGRPKIYGDKIYIRDLFKDLTKFKIADSPIYGDKKVKLQYCSEIVLLRPKALKVQIILVIHPTRGNIILVTTDLKLPPLTAIKLYGDRFKIEVTFKTAKYLLGLFDYHFWMKDMEKINKKTGNQKLSNKSETYKNQVKRKLNAFTIFIQVGFIALGLLQYLSLRYPDNIWNKFRSWLRTMNKKKSPSEAVVSQVLQDNLFDFIWNLPPDEKLKLFLQKHIDFSRFPGRHKPPLHEI